MGTYPPIALSAFGASDFQSVAQPTSPYVRPADGFNVGLEPSRHSLTYGSGNNQFNAEYDPLAIEYAPQQPALPRGF